MGIGKTQSLLSNASRRALFQPNPVHLCRAICYPSLPYSAHFGGGDSPLNVGAGDHRLYVPRSARDIRVSSQVPSSSRLEVSHGSLRHTGQRASICSVRISICAVCGHDVQGTLSRFIVAISDPRGASMYLVHERRQAIPILALSAHVLFFVSQCCSSVETSSFLAVLRLGAYKILQAIPTARTLESAYSGTRIDTLFVSGSSPHLLDLVATEIRASGEVRTSQDERRQEFAVFRLARLDSAMT